MVDGIQVPARQDHSATNFILNQTPGKLPLKDLFTFIRTQREAAELRRKKARTMTENDDEDEHDRQARELRFEMGYREIEMFDKQKEIKSMVCLGEAPMNDAAQEAVRRAREERYHKLLENQFDLDMERHSSKLSRETVCIPNK